MAVLGETLRTGLPRVALVEADATISDMTGERRYFAAADDLRNLGVGVGLDHFDVCTPEQVYDPRALVSCRRDIFSVFHPCRLPDRIGWTVLAAAPGSFTPPTSLMMRHFDLTDRLSQEIAGATGQEAEHRGQACEGHRLRASAFSISVFLSKWSRHA
jgi:hypothetical protein